MLFEKMKKALVNAAERAGLKEYEIYYQREESLNAETLKDEISSFSSSVGGGICFRCIVDGKMGYASGELMTEEAMEELVACAISNARCIDNDDEVFIFAGSPAYATPTAPEARLFDAGKLRETVLELQRRLYAESDKVGDGTQSVVLSAVEERRLCNSNGLELSNRVGLCGAYAAPVVRDGDEAQESFEFCEGTSIEDFAELPAKAVRGALDKMGAGTVPSGKYTWCSTANSSVAFFPPSPPCFRQRTCSWGSRSSQARRASRSRQIASRLLTIP